MTDVQNALDTIARRYSGRDAKSHDDLMTVTDVATMSGVSTDTVKRWLREGLFPNANKGPGRTQPWYIPVSDILALGEKLEQQSSTSFAVVNITSWTETGPDDDRRARLAATIQINDLPMRVDAHAVTQDVDTGEQRAAVWDEDLAAIHGAVTADGPFQTTTIDGRDYVLVAAPYC